MSDIKDEIIKILINNQEKCKIGSDGDYSTELCIFAYDFDFIADKIESLFQTMAINKENKEVITRLKDMLSWSGRLGSDEIFEIREIIEILKQNDN